jgi:hypothetical protein
MTVKFLGQLWSRRVYTGYVHVLLNDIRRKVF